MSGKYSFFCICFLLLSLLSFGQSKPKIGLVLSGGGAKGIAHIGVLKSMEEAGIVPDMIVGTSMGAIVGALYSLGYSADEIEQKILSIDWDNILTNQVPLNSIAFEEKEYYTRYTIEFPISEGKPKLPSGLIESQMLTEVLQYHLWPSMNYDNFDDFPIPFRCIGTDLETGEAIAFKSGSLYKAVRSSMAMPGAFTAVNLDTTYAVDGGLVENFPVKRVIEMGADYVIGVNVSSTTLSGNESFETIGEIAMSVAMIGSNKRSQEEIALCNIYIEPDVGEYSAGNFNKAEEILAIGENAAKAHKEEFDALLVKAGGTRQSLPNPKISPLKLTNVKFDKSELYSDELLRSKLNLNLNDSVQREELARSIRNVFGINGFHKVEYKLDRNTKTELDIDLEEKTPGRLFASLHIDNVFATGLLLNLTYRDLLGKDSRSLFILDISQNPKFRFDYYKYTGQRKRLALNFRYNYLNEEVPFFEEGEVNDVIINRRHELRAGILTTQSLKRSLMLFGYYSTYTAADQFENLVPDEVDRLRISDAGIQLGYLVNTLDNRNFPKSGSEINFILNAITWSEYGLIAQDNIDSIPVLPGSDIKIPIELYQEVLNELTPGPYFQLTAQINKYFALNHTLSLIGDLGFGFTLADIETNSITKEFRITGRARANLGDFRAYGYNFEEVSSPNLGVFSASVQKVAFHNLFLRAGASIIGTYRNVNINDALDEFDFDEFRDDNLQLGYGIEASFRSRLGPISAGISKNTEDPHLRYFFSFGYSFNYSDP